MKEQAVKAKEQFEEAVSKYPKMASTLLLVGGSFITELKNEYVPHEHPEIMAVQKEREESIEENHKIMADVLEAIRSLND